MQTSNKKYDNISVALHWIIGIGILALAGLELFRGEFPKGHFIREGLKPIHQPVGTLLFALIIVRVTWRLLLAKVPTESHKFDLAGIAAKLVHLALYALMIGLPLLGLVYVFGNDKVIDFGLFSLALPLKASLGGFAKSARWWHETLGIAMFGLALLHAAAALGHHYILKDGLLNKMRFAKNSDANDTDFDPPLVAAE
ncbi:MAG: cytochrome b/b6 domain-containing protein [Hyphomicrobiaceae bacterium]